MAEKEVKEMWDKLHSLDCDIDYLLQERDSKPEQVKAKHAWDMILSYILREIKDVKQLVKVELERMNG